MTPAGRMSLISSPKRSVASGVVAAGFSTMVLPASRAAGTLKAIRISGKFHGVMAPMTPSGRRCISTFLAPSSWITFVGRSSEVK